MTDDLTPEQLDRIIANHESGVQLTGVNVYRQLRAALGENAALKRERDIFRAGFIESSKVCDDYAVHLHGRGGSLKPIPECVAAREMIDRELRNHER